MSNKHNIRRVNKSKVQKANPTGLEIFRDANDGLIYYKDDNGVAIELSDSNALNNYLTIINQDIDNIQTQINALTPANQLLSGGVTYSGTGLIYDVSALIYRISDTTYTANPTSVTLTASDPTDPRIDVIYVDDAGIVNYITGTPDPSPVKPTVDNASQLELTFVTIAAGATTPTLTVEDVYKENVEWVGTTNSTADFASTLDTYEGTLSIDTDGVLGNGEWLKLTPGAPYTINGGVLGFRIKAKADMSGNSGRLRIGFFNSGALVGSPVEIGGSVSSTFGFVGSNIADHQSVVIDITNFGALPSTVDELRFYRQGGGSAVDFFLDDISIQELPTSPIAGSSSLASNDQIITDIVRYIDLAGDTASEYLEVRDNLGATILKISADGQVFSNATKGSDGTTYGDNAGIGGTGSARTIIGAYSGSAGTMSDQTVVGAYAGNNNTGDHQTAMGVRAGDNNTGVDQSVLGKWAGDNNTGIRQTGIGTNAGANNTGDNQTALGRGAGSAQSGIDQVAIGRETGKSNSGDYQVVIGGLAGQFNTGAANVNVGYKAGSATAGAQNNTSSDNSVFLGYETRALALANTNTIVIGANTTGNGSNTATLGDDSIINTHLKGNINFKKGGFEGIFTHANTVDRTYTFKDGDGTVAFMSDLIANTNFANSDLTFTANRLHDTDGNQFIVATDGLLATLEALVGITSTLATLTFSSNNITIDAAGCHITYSGSILLEAVSAGLKVAPLNTDLLGIWGATPIAQPAHIADPTAMAALTGSAPAAAAALTQDALTDNTGGTASTTLADITEANNAGSADRVPTEDALASIAAQLAKISTDISALKTAVDANNAAIDLNITDIAAAKTAVDANNTAIDSILADLAATGLQAAV